LIDRQFENFGTPGKNGILKTKYKILKIEHCPPTTDYQFYIHEIGLKF
jgi:hypothetical protein